jgi:hypothetical protein
MKNASVTSLRVKPELRKAAEKVLEQGETLSAFIESSLRTNIEKRLNHKVSSSQEGLHPKSSPGNLMNMLMR